MHFDCIDQNHFKSQSQTYLNHDKYNTIRSNAFPLSSFCRRETPLPSTKNNVT